MNDFLVRSAEDQDEDNPITAVALPSLPTERRRYGPLYAFWDQVAPMCMEEVYTLPNMTLCVAVAAKDGVVLGTDTQETRSDGSKRNGVSKMVEVSDTMAVGLSGTGNVAKGILGHRGLLEHARTLKDADLIGDLFGSCFLGSIQGHSHRPDWYTRTYHLKDGAVDPKVLDLRLLLASFDGEAVIGEVSPQTGYSFAPIQRAHCMGVTPFANALLPTLTPIGKPLPTIDEAEIIVALCLMVTADRFGGVGEPFDLVRITKGKVDQYSTSERPRVLESARKLCGAWKELFKLLSEEGASNSEAQDQRGSHHVDD